LLGFGIYHFSTILAVFVLGGCRTQWCSKFKQAPWIAKECFKGSLTNLPGKLSQIKGNNTPLKCQHLKLQLLLT
jgi:hypothetical protein